MPSAPSCLKSSFGLPDLVEIWVFLGIVAVVFLVWRIGMNFSDKERIREAAMAKGWTEVKVLWEPFAPGWFFEGQERHYLVVYRDRSGRRSERFCKIRMLGDVYWKA